MKIARVASLVAVLVGGAAAPAGAWAPVAGKLMTRFAADVSPERALPEYPRPQMARPRWQNLNGLWDYAIRPKDAPRPDAFDGQILVPFPIESALSGVAKPLGDGNRLWYRRTFTLPAEWAGQRVRLNFGAVDWEAAVWVDGKEVGSHRGGYDGFGFDVTGALSGDGPHEVVVAVLDPTDAGPQPRGKQVRRPHSIWYTPTSGIWQTAWLEPVPAASIAGLKLVPDVDARALRITVAGDGDLSGVTVRAVARDGGREAGRVTGRPGQALKLPVKGARLWSPDAPFLYDLDVTLVRKGKPVDQVSSYFGMRKIALGKDASGTLRLFLNDKPLFQFGPLDQGFWPDGLYTAPSDEALRSDIEVTKKLGFNMARKHVKVEPDRWYYWCDKLGLLVWQDMPSGDRSIGAKDPDVTRTPESIAIYERELAALIEGRGNHPSIVMWVPFNEGWGQFDTARVVASVKQRDPSRLVDDASGWSDRGVGDVNDMHAYPGPKAPPVEPKRAIVLGEFGGLGLPVRGHTWQDEKNWGYKSYPSAEELTAAYLKLIDKLQELAGGPGLAAAVYTQTTDVEIEVNGLMTYDRAQVKMDAEKVAAANRKVYAVPPKAASNP